MIEIKAKEFENILAKKEIVVVDFWATWCKPCVTVEGILKQLEPKFDGQVLFAKMNTDENLEVARKYNVLSLPTVIIFKRGEQVKRIVGSKSIYDFEDAIYEAIYQ